MAELFRYNLQGNLTNEVGGGPTLTAEGGFDIASDQVTGPGGIYANGANLDGSDDALQLSAEETITGDATIGCWVLGKTAGDFSVWLGGNASYSRFGHKNDVTNFSVVPNTTFGAVDLLYDYNDLSWVHVVFVRRGTDLYYYINGVEQTTVTPNFTGDITLGFLGRDNTNNNYHTGALAGVFAADHAFTAGEVNTDYLLGLDDSPSLAIVRPAANQIYQMNEVGSYQPEFAVESSSGSLEYSFDGSTWVAADETAGTVIIDAPKAVSLFKTEFLNEGWHTLSVRETGTPGTVVTRSFGVGDVLIAVGQSNAQGQATAPVATVVPSGSPGAWYFNRFLTPGDPWKAVDEVGTGPVYDDTNTTQFSAWPVVLNKLMEQHPNRPFGIVSVPTAGSDIFGDWIDDGSSALVWARHGIRAAGLNSGKLLWWQGEYNAGSSQAAFTPATMKDALVQLRVDLNAVLDEPGPMYVTQIQTLAGGSFDLTNLDNTRQGQYLSWLEDGIRQGPIFHDVNWITDQVHYKTVAEVNQVGDRWYQALQDRGAFRVSIAQATITSTEINLNYSRVLDHTVTAPDANDLFESDFSVQVGIDLDSMNTLSSGSNKAVLNTDAAINGSQTLTLDYAKGETGRDNNVIYDEFGMPAPMQLDIPVTLLVAVSGLTPNPTTGHKSLLKINTNDDYDPAVVVTIGNVTDVSMDDVSIGMAELKRRANEYTKNLPSLFNAFKISFQLIHGIDITVFNFLRQKFFSGIPFEMTIEMYTNGEGLKFPVILENFPWNQPLEEVNMHECTAALAYFVHDGSEIDVTQIAAT